MIIPLAAIRMLSNFLICLAIDSYEPISDNAARIKYDFTSLINQEVADSDETKVILTQFQLRSRYENCKGFIFYRYTECDLKEYLDFETQPSFNGIIKTINGLIDIILLEIIEPLQDFNLLIFKVKILNTVFLLNLNLLKLLIKKLISILI